VAVGIRSWVCEVMRHVVDTRRTKGSLQPTFAISNLFHLATFCLHECGQNSIGERTTHQSFNVARHDVVLVKEPIDVLLTLKRLATKN